MTTSGTDSERQAQRPRFGPGSHGARIESAENTSATVLRLTTYLKRYTWQLVIVTVFVLVSTLTSLAGPMLVGRAIDDYIIPGDIPGLVRISLILLATFLVGSLAMVAQGWIMVHIAQRLMRDIRGQLFEHMQTLSMKYHDDHEVGDLMSRVTNDTDVINQVLSNGLPSLVSYALSLVGILVAMFSMSWQLALGALLVLPLMLIITGAVTQRTRQSFRQMQRSLGALNAYAEEHVAGVRVVQAYARQSQTTQNFKQITATYREAGIAAEAITAILGPMFTTMSTVSIAVIAGLGGWLALRGLVSVGVIVAFVAYIQNFFRPLRQLAMLYNQLQSAIAGAERIFEVLDTEPIVQDEPQAITLPDIAGLVEFEHVSFAYEPDKPVLIDVSLKALPGQTVALVGPTGAGKTTIINLLSRFYDADEGIITIDGQDIRNIEQKSLRQQLGIVLQDTFLFSDTVMNNLRYGRLEATDDEVVAAARLANADRFIRRLPEGYDTPVSEQGSNFSQGQRQLLAIARAILADPRILILDEATSSVDTRTEIQIQQALLRLLEGRTAFVIAHRLSTIREADQVLVVNDHRIIERGTHQELLDMGGFYHNLYMSQFRRAEEVRETAAVG